MPIVRYRYRTYPTEKQVQTLARTFGCARVVYNDSLRLRQDAHARGKKLSDTDVQRRVVTEAKRTPERAWLGEVASVAMVQACQDARRAYRNWFDSLVRRRTGRRVGAPRFRSRKDNRQSIRLTRNGFSVRANGRVYRRFPSSQLCSACGHRDGPKPLHIRGWTCSECGAEHDRDLNAARNILAEGRRMAAGLADINACGGDVRPGFRPAAADEAGTRLGALV